MKQRGAHYYAYVDVIVDTITVFFRCFFARRDSVGQLLSAHEAHINSIHYSHSFAPPTTRSDGFLWITTPSCFCNAHNNNSNSSSTCCCNIRRCCKTRYCNTLYRAKITPVQVMLFWLRLSTLQQQ